MAGLSALLSLTQPVFGLEGRHIAYELWMETSCGMKLLGEDKYCGQFFLLLFLFFVVVEGHFTTAVLAGDHQAVRLGRSAAGCAGGEGIALCKLGDVMSCMGSLLDLEGMVCWVGGGIFL